jgi:large subunit ribosomal protein L23
MKHSSQPITRPRITEKATISSEKNVYVFEVHQGAGKKELAKTIFDIYKVKPVSINITRNPAKNVIVRGKRGKTAGVKKAYVYLKAGDKIEII